MMIWRTLLLFVPLTRVECGASKNACLIENNCIQVEEMQGIIKSPRPVRFSDPNERSWRFKTDMQKDEHSLLLRIKRANPSLTNNVKNCCSETLTIQGEETTQHSSAKILRKGDTPILTLTTESYRRPTPILTKIIGSSGDDQISSGSEYDRSRQGISGSGNNPSQTEVDLDVAPTAEGEIIKEMGTTTLPNQEQHSATTSKWVTTSKDSRTTSSHKEPITEEQTLSVHQNLPPSLQTTLNGETAIGGSETSTHTSYLITSEESRPPFAMDTMEPPRPATTVLNERERSTHKSDPTTRDENGNTPFSTNSTRRINLVLNKNEVSTYASDPTTDRKSDTPLSTLTTQSTRPTTRVISENEVSTYASDPTTDRESDTPFSTLTTESIHPTTHFTSEESTAAGEVHTPIEPAGSENKDEDRNSGRRPANGAGALFFGIWAIYLAFLS